MMFWPTELIRDAGIYCRGAAYGPDSHLPGSYPRPYRMRRFRIVNNNAALRKIARLFECVGRANPLSLVFSADRPRSNIE